MATVCYSDTSVFSDNWQGVAHILHGEFHGQTTLSSLKSSPFRRRSGGSSPLHDPVLHVLYLQGEEPIYPRAQYKTSQAKVANQHKKPLECRLMPLLMWPHWINLLFLFYNINLAVFIGFSGTSGQTWLLGGTDYITRITLSDSPFSPMGHPPVFQLNGMLMCVCWWL